MMLKMFVGSMKMKLRDRTSLFYALFFPIIFLTVFGLFDLNKVQETRVALVAADKTPLTDNIVNSLKNVQQFKVTDFGGRDEAIDQVQENNQDIAIELKDISLSPGQPKMEILASYKSENVQNANIALNALSTLAYQINAEITQTPQVLEIKKDSLNNKHFKYFDFLFPGILGIGLMSYSINSIGVYITRMREQLILKRLFATPVKTWQFFLSETISYLVIAFVQIVIITFFSKYVFKADIYGSFPLFVLLSLFGTLIFINIGFIISTLSKTSNAAEGLATIVTLPMMMLSGTFFPTDFLPKIIQGIVKYFPLTALLDSLRTVIISGEGLEGTTRELGIMFVWFAITYIFLIFSFRLKED